MKRSETGKRLLTLPNLLACLIILLASRSSAILFCSRPGDIFTPTAPTPSFGRRLVMTPAVFLMRILHMPACFRLAVNC